MCGMYVSLLVALHMSIDKCNFSTRYTGCDSRPLHRHSPVGPTENDQRRFLSKMRHFYYDVRDLNTL